jgi:hypothetical protein
MSFDLTNGGTRIAGLLEKQLSYRDGLCKKFIQVLTMFPLSGFACESIQTIH